MLGGFKWLLDEDGARMVPTFQFCPARRQAFEALYDDSRKLSTTSFRTPGTGVCVIATSPGTAGMVASAFVVSSFWRREISDRHRSSSDRTHAKDLKNLVEVQPPGGDHFLVILRVKASRYRIPFVPLD